MGNLTNPKLLSCIKAFKNSIGKIKKHEVHTKEGNIREITFKINSLIGRGTFGLVSLIETDNGIEALKTVYQKNIYYNRELDILLDIDHPNIIRINSYFYTEKNQTGHFLNMCLEYMPTCLQDLVKNKNIETSTIKKLYKQAMSGLNYLHELRICHRDIKPANILLNNNMVLKICDFGSAKYLVDGMDNISYICSRYYRAPENLLNDTNYTTKIDIWAMALVFCEFRVEQPLFCGNSSKDMLDIILRTIEVPKNIAKKYNLIVDQPSVPSEFKNYLYSLFYDRDIVAVIYKSLKVDPEKRISAEEVLRSKYL